MANMQQDLDSKVSFLSGMPIFKDVDASALIPIASNI